MPAAPSKPRSKKNALPVVLDGATAFAEDAELMGSFDFIRLFKSQPQFAKPLAAAIKRVPGSPAGAGPFGRPSLPGQWELAYLAFVMSGQADVQPWWKHTTDELWRECGFTERPPYDRVHDWFGPRLEARAEAFSAVVALLVQHARKRTDGVVGRDIWVDGTEAETNARLRHACPKWRSCWKRSKSSFTGARQAAKSAEANLSEVKAERHAQADLPESELDDGLLLGPAGKNIWNTSDGRLMCKVGRSDCIYEILDRTAGMRAYTGPRGLKRFWLGFYNQKAIDHYTGAPVAIHLSSASIPEWKSYPHLFNRVIENVGEAPRAVVADKGFSLSSVFELHTKVGTASVMPWRKPGTLASRADEDCEKYDRHGIPRCKYCGGETQMVRFNKANPQPRLWFKCVTGGGDCDKQQSMYCSENWRLLVPIWRNDEIYMALSGARSRYERVHHHWRQRYRVGSDDHMLRPKRRGIACQQLRANAALVVEWMLILWREGWLGSARRNNKREHTSSASREVASLISARRSIGLNLPYGKQARRKWPDAPLRPGGPWEPARGT